jgi:hypothetical protein
VRRGNADTMKIWIKNESGRHDTINSGAQSNRDFGIWYKNVDRTYTDRVKQVMGKVSCPL